MSKTVKDLETYATLLESSIYDLYKAQKINDPLKKFCLYGVRKNSIKPHQQSILFAFIEQIKQNKSAIYPHLNQLIQSSSTYYLCFQSFNLMLDVTLSKGYKQNYLYNITKRKQYIDDLRRIGDSSDRQLSPVNLVMDDQHVYCLPAYNSPKGNYRQSNQALMIKLIYSLITGEKLLDDRNKISENGKFLVTLLEGNYTNPHLDSILHQNLQRDEEEIEFNNLGVNNNLKNLAKDLDFRRSHNALGSKSEGYDMNFDNWTPDMLLDDERVYKPTISGRISTIVDDKNYPSIDDYQPFKKSTPSMYPGFLTKSEQNKSEGYKSYYPEFVDNKQSQNKQTSYNQSSYPVISPQTTNIKPQVPSYPTDFGNVNSNKGNEKPQQTSYPQKLDNQSGQNQGTYKNNIPSQYPGFPETKINQNQYNNHQMGINNIPSSPKQSEQIRQEQMRQQQLQQLQQHQQYKQQQQYQQMLQQQKRQQQQLLHKQQQQQKQQQAFTQNKIPQPIIKIPQIQTKPNQQPTYSPQQPTTIKPYIPSRPPIQNRLTKNGKKDEINHILTSVTSFMSNVQPRSTASKKKSETLESLFKPENDSPDKIFQHALENYLGQFKLYSRLIKSFLTYYLTSNLGRVASYLLARSCVHRKLRLINDLIDGKDIFDLGKKVMQKVDVGKYVERIDKTVYKEDPEQFKLLINFKSITPETYAILKPYLGPIDESDKTQQLCFFYLYTLSLRENKQDLHHVMLYDALFVLHYKGYQFLYNYKQLPKQYNEEYVKDKRDFVRLLVR